MLKSIQTWLGLPNHPYISALLIMATAMIVTVVLSYSIKLVLVNFAKKYQKESFARVVIDF